MSDFPATPTDPSPSPTEVLRQSAAPQNEPVQVTIAPPKTEEQEWEDFLQKSIPDVEKAHRTVADVEKEEPVVESAQDQQIRQALQTGEAATPAETQPAEGPTVEDISKMVGLDLSGFSNPQDAMAAARLFIANQLQTPTPPANQNPLQPVPGSPVQEQEEDPFSFELGEYADEATVKNFNKIKENYSALANEVKTLKAQREAEVQAQRRQMYDQVQARADEVITGADEERYGKPGARTPVQEFAVQNVYNTVLGLVRKLSSTGREVPDIDTLTRQAVFMDTGKLPGSEQSVQQEPEKPAQTFQPPRSAPSIPPASHSQEFGVNDFHMDPAFARAARALGYQG